MREDCVVSLDESKEWCKKSTNPSYDCPGAIEVCVQALCHPHFPFAIIMTLKVLSNFNT